MLNLSGKQYAYLQSTTAFVIFCAACSMLHVLEVWNSCQTIETRFAINLKVWYTIEKYIQQHYARRTCLIIIKTIFQIKLLLDKCTKRKGTCIWVKSRRCNWTVLSCYLVCYQLIAKPGNKTVAPPWLAWWRHQMETFSALLAICAGNSPVTGEFPTQRPVTRSFDVYFDLRPNERLSKQSWGWWFETLSRSLWRHFNVWPNVYFKAIVPCIITCYIVPRNTESPKLSVPCYWGKSLQLIWKLWPIDEIYRCLIFKWVTETLLHENKNGRPVA